MWFLLFFIATKTWAQKFDLDKVTKAELLEKQHKKDSSAPAAFIFKKAKTTFKYSEEKGFTCATTFQVKLKIYKKEGLAWANFKIPYYIGYETLEDESVTIKSANTYTLENDKIVKTKITADGKFKEKINEYWEAKSVTFPNVKVGAIIELEYILQSDNISVLPDFQYQYEIPVDFAEYISHIPELYLYKSIQKGYVELSYEQKIVQTSQSYESKIGISSATQSLHYRNVVSSYTVANVPALKEEDYVNNINNYYGKLEQELQAILYPDKEPKQIATTWESVAKSVFEDKDFSAAINSFEYFKNDILSIKNDAQNQEELIKRLFNYVKNRMNWNEKFGYYPRRKLEIAYAEKVGNIAEINLMLVSMLRMVGVEANPVLVSTRANGMALFPNKSLFNYVVVAVNNNNTTMLLDATDKLSDINKLPIRALNGLGRLIKSDGTSTEIELMPKINSKDLITIFATINNQGEISGKVREQYFDYNAYVFRKNYNGISSQSYTEKLEKEYHGVTIESYNVQNNTDLELPIIESYNFTATNSVEVIGDKMYFSPFLFFEKPVNPFKQETREYPIDFVYPNQDKYTISLTLPEGFSVETLPQSKAIALPDNLGNFKYNITNNGNQIQLLYTQDINQAVIGAEYYQQLKNFFKEIVNKQAEKIVLKKG